MLRHQQAAEGVAEHDLAYLPQEDPREAVTAATRARNLFRQQQDPREAEILHTLAQAQLARGNPREATRCAEEQLFLARKTKDRLQEANAQVLCAAMYCEQQRLAPAQRAAQAAKDIFLELGHDEGLQHCDWYLDWFRQMQEQLELEQRQQPRRFGERAVFDSSGRPLRGQERTRRSELGGGASQLYRRKAFPWTSHQQEAMRE